MASLLEECGWTLEQLNTQVEALARSLAEQHLTHRQAALTLSVAMLELASRSPGCFTTVERCLGVALISIALARRGISPEHAAELAQGTQVVQTQPPDAANASQIIQTINALGMTADDAAEGLRQCAHALLKEKPASRPALLKAMRDMIHEFAVN